MELTGRLDTLITKASELPFVRHQSQLFTFIREGATELIVKKTVGHYLNVGYSNQQDFDLSNLRVRHRIFRRKQSGGTCSTCTCTNPECCRRSLCLFSRGFPALA
jgi:hypothetical protein